MNELKNIDVHILSIVNKGANKKRVIWKSDHTGDSPYQRYIPILKSNEEKRIVYGIVYSPDEEDAHGEFATAAEIEKACYRFMKKSKTDSVDTQHDMEINKDCYVGENWIVKSVDELFPNDRGAWAVGIKVDNDEIWKGIKDGTYTGISMYGFAEKVSKNSDNNSGNQPDNQIEKGIMNFFKKILNPEMEKTEELKKDFNDRIVMMDFPKLLDALYNAAYDILYDDNIVDKTAGILESVDQFKQHIQNIETAKSMTPEDPDFKKKLRAAWDSIENVFKSASGAIEKRKQFEIKKTSSKEEGDIEMTAEEIQKKIDEALKPVQEAHDLLKKSAEENEAKLLELQKENDELKRLSKGSSQEDPDPGKSDKTEVKKYSWLSGIKS